MSGASNVELPDALERAASALRADADQIRPANGDPVQLLHLLDGPAAARVLEWLLANEPAAGEELANEWLEQPECDPSLIAQVSDASLPKAGRKALRRIQHRLRSRGVALPEPEVAPVVAKVSAPDDAFEAALIGPLDAHGTRVVYVVEDNPTGGARIFEVLLGRDHGLIRFEVYSAPKGKARRFVKEATTRGEHAAVEAPASAVRAVIARSLAAQPANRPVPRGFPEWRKRMTADPATTPTPGRLAREALGAPPADAMARGVALVQERTVGPWVPDHPALQEAATAIRDLGKSELVVSGAARAEQVEGIVGDACDRIFDDAGAESSAICFDETAYVFWKQQRDDDARACLAAADALRAGSEARRQVARAMLDVLLEPVTRALDAANADSPSPGAD